MDRVNKPEEPRIYPPWALGLIRELEARGEKVLHDKVCPDHHHAPVTAQGCVMEGCEFKG